MSQNAPRDITPYNGMFKGVGNRIKLIIRLMSDPRVNMLLKAIPLTSLIYLFFPDIMPGPIDDAAIVWFSTFLFVELCPPEVVQEHTEAINRADQGQSQMAQQEDEIEIDGEVVEGEFREDK